MSRTGFVNLQKILATSKKVAERNRPARALREERGKELEALRKELASAQAQLENEKKSPAGRFDLQRAVEAKQRILRYRQEDAAAEVQALERKILDGITDDLDKLLGELAKEGGVEMVFTVPNPAIAFAAPSLDLTEELLRRFEGQSAPAAKAKVRP